MDAAPSREDLQRHLLLHHQMDSRLVEELSTDALFTAHELLDTRARVGCPMCTDALVAGVQKERAGICAGCGRRNPIDFGRTQ